MPSLAGASGTCSAAGQAVPSILDPRVAGGSHDGLLAVYSLSKQSNLAGYRAAFVAGDAAIMANLVNSRKHAGMIVPYPVQEAMRVALGDDAHVLAQKDLYRGRRERLVPALEALRADDPRVRAPACTCGARPAKPPGTPLAGSRSAGSWWVRACSTATRATATSGWPSPAADERIDAARGAAGYRGYWP